MHSNFRFVLDDNNENENEMLSNWVKRGAKDVGVRLVSKSSIVFRVLDMIKFRMQNSVYERIENEADQKAQNKQIERELVPEFPQTNKNQTVDTRIWNDFIHHSCAAILPNRCTWKEAFERFQSWKYEPARFVLLVESAKRGGKIDRKRRIKKKKTNNNNNAEQKENDENENENENDPNDALYNNINNNNNNNINQLNEDNSDGDEKSEYSAVTDNDTSNDNDDDSDTDNTVTDRNRKRRRNRSMNADITRNQLQSIEDRGVLGDYSVMSGTMFKAYQNCYGELESSPDLNIKGNSESELPKTRYGLLDRIDYLKNSDRFVGELISVTRFSTTDNYSRLGSAVCTLWMRTRTINGGENPISMAGTGFMISPTHLMTCFHCIYDAKNREAKTPPIPFSLYAVNGEIECRFDMNGTVNTLEFNQNDIVYPENHATRTDIGFDVAIIRINKERPSNIYVPPHFIPLIPPLNTFIPFASTYGIDREQRQRIVMLRPEKTCHFIYPTINNNIVLGFHNWEVHYTNETEGGCSGSPCLFANGQLAAIHRRGGASDYTSINAAYFNLGLRIDLFLRDAFNYADLPHVKHSSYNPTITHNEQMLFDELKSIYYPNTIPTTTATTTTTTT